ncbi:MAG: hypothetical protein II453_09235 [Alphaproteobacteria bacterium]|nr:hypothetical protein [Alphaproteobacteria bacterium]MBQ3944055.1 hypothetical protein [Alphaproteobacteria bacterium]
MNILLSEHTFLVISFLLAVWVLYKFSYKRLNKQIGKSIDDIRNTITNNEQLRQNAEDEIKRLSLEINKLEETARAEETRARQEVKLRSDKNNEKIAKIILNKNREYENAKLALERTFLSEAQKEYVENIIHKIKESLGSTAKNEDVQGKAIENALNMIEKYFNKTK